MSIFLLIKTSVGDSALISEAIIVLAHHMNERGELNIESRARADKAVELWNANKNQIIVTSGWAYRPDSTIPICDAVKTYLLNEHKINPDKVLSEKNARDTVGDAIFTRLNFAIPANWKAITVVTSNYHVQRTYEIFSFIYGSKTQVEVIGTAVEQSEDVHLYELKSLTAFRNTFRNIEEGNIESILLRLSECHPYYNGASHQKITV